MNLPARDPEVLLTYDGFVRALAEDLVAEVHRADDVAQETWLAALEHGPRDRRSLRAWLAALVRNFASKLERSERNRAQREQAVARAEAIPSTHEILEREAVRRSVVDAVVELEEPYRSVVLLRYFEHLPPREIARRLSVPVATVHTRTKRALERLRTKLDQEHRGDRGAWMAALPLVPRLPAPQIAAAAVAPFALLTGGSSLLGVLAMSIQSKVAVAVALLACSSVALWQLSTGPVPDFASGGQPADTASAAFAQRTAQQDLARRAIEPAASPRREVASASAPETRAAEATGSLFVRVLWSNDKTPAAHLAAWVTPSWQVNPVFDRIDVESGDDGTFRVPSIRAGTVKVWVFRGREKSIEVAAGKQAELTVEVGRGLTVLGTVVRSEGQPVAGAEIWLSREDSLAGDVVARSGADGSFRLRDVSNPAIVGALDPGRGRSPLVHVFDRKWPGPWDEIHLRLTLRAGVGEVAGRVLDPAGSPVAGGVVVLGKNQPSIVREGGVVDGRPVLEARTDGEGRFGFRTLAPGRHEVAIRAKEFAPWTGMVESREGTCTTLEARLGRGSTLLGTVQRSTGEPVPGAEVSVGAGDGNAGIASSLVRSDARGAFRLDALAPGRLDVKAVTEDLGRAHAELTAAEGQEVRWDARLSGGLELRGRVLDHVGAPLAEWSVSADAEPARAGTNSWGSAKTDAEGRFRIPNLADGTHRVEVRGDRNPFPVDVRDGVLPGGAELTFRIAAGLRATAFLTGVVVDAEEHPLGDVTLWLSRSGGGSTERATESGTGRFRFGPLPPARYRLRYSQGKGLNSSHRTVPSFCTEERELAAGETQDVGVLRIVPGGTLRLTAQGEGGVDVSGAYLWMSARTSAGSYGIDSIKFEQGVTRWIGAGGDGERVLAPGPYQIQVLGDGFAHALHTFEIRSGKETQVELLLRRGIRKTFVIENTASESARPRALLTVHDSAGKQVLDWSVGFKAGSTVATHRAWLLPGTYRARATSDARAVEVEFRVLPEASGDETVRLTFE